MTATDRSTCAARAMEERDELLGKNRKGEMGKGEGDSEGFITGKKTRWKRDRGRARPSLGHFGWGRGEP